MPSNRRIIRFLALFAALAAATASIFALAAAPPTRAAWLGGLRGDGVSFIRVQNAGGAVAVAPAPSVTPTLTSEAAISIDLLGLGGLSGPGGRHTFARDGVLPGRTRDLPTADEINGLRGLYGATLRADRPIGTMSGVLWPRTGKAAEISAAIPATDLLVPTVLRRRDDTSYIAIQNTDPHAAAQVTIDLTLPNGSAALATVARTIPPGGGTLVDLAMDREFQGLTAEFRGGMRIRSDRPVAVAAYVDIRASQKGMYAYEGIPATQASDRLTAPIVRNYFYGTTAIAFMNPGREAVEVTVTYLGSDFSSAKECKRGTKFVHNGGPVSVPAGASVLFYQGNVRTETGTSGLPGDCLGYAVIEVQGGKGVAIVTDADLSRGIAAAYTAVGREQAAKRVAIPLFRRGHGPGEMSTGLLVTNMGTAMANVTMDLWPDNCNGTVISRCGTAYSTTLWPGESYFWYTPIQSLPDGFIGSAMLSSTQPIAAIVNDVSDNYSRDPSMYNGIPLDPAGELESAVQFVPLVLGGDPGWRVYLPNVRR
jgi:hypothetical protein